MLVVDVPQLEKPPDRGLNNVTVKYGDGGVLLVSVLMVVSQIEYCRALAAGGFVYSIGRRDQCKVQYIGKHVLAQCCQCRRSCVVAEAT